MKLFGWYVHRRRVETEDELFERIKDFASLRVLANSYRSLTANDSVAEDLDRIQDEVDMEVDMEMHFIKCLIVRLATGE